MECMTISIAIAKPQDLADFYSSVFGFKVETEEESGVVVRKVTLMPNLALALVPDESGEPPKTGMGQIFHITDSQTTEIIERAKRKGCDVKVSEDGKSAFLFDPAGQPWEIACPD